MFFWVLRGQGKARGGFGRVWEDFFSVFFLSGCIDLKSISWLKLVDQGLMDPFP